MNIFKSDYFPRRYIFRNLRQFFRNVKFAWQRATKGYADRDVWNLDISICGYLAATLEHLANTTHSYPDHSFPQFEDWQKELRELAHEFQLCAQSEDTELSRIGPALQRLAAIFPDLWD